MCIGNGCGEMLAGFNGFEAIKNFTVDLVEQNIHGPRDIFSLSCTTFIHT